MSGGPFLLLPVMLSLGAAAAFAACPGSLADSEVGIRIGLDYGAQSELVRSQEGIVREVQTVEGDSSIAEIEKVHGVYPLRVTNRRSSEADAFVNGYAVTWDTENLPEPDAGLIWQSSATRAFLDSPDEATPINFSVEVTGEGMLTIGECSYETLTIRTVMDESDATFITEEELDYIPALGISLVRRNRTILRDDSEPGEWYDSIARLEIASN